MAWSKVSDKRWERSLDGLERAVVILGHISASLSDGRAHYTIFSRVTLEMDMLDTIGSLRHAWKQMRYEQPQLAATIEGTKMVYNVPDEGDVQEWLASNFIVSTASDAEELYQSSLPIQQPTLYYVAETSEVVFRGLHYTIDGMGTLMFWNKYLSALASPKENIRFGDEPTRLAPTLDEVLGIPEQLTPAQTDNAKALYMSWLGNAPGIGLASKGAAGRPGKCQSAEAVFPVEATEALIKACRSKGISVTAAVHAAYIEVISKEVDPGSKPIEYVTGCPVNVRPHLPEPYASSDSALPPYFFPIPCKLSLPASYSDTAEALNAFYRAVKADEKLPKLRSHLGRAMLDFVQGPELASAPYRSDACMSSLGIVENHLGREYGGGIKVRDMKFGLEHILGTSAFYLYTFHHQMRLVYCFNDGYERLEDVKTCLDEMQAVLGRELLGLSGEN